MNTTVTCNRTRETAANIWRCDAPDHPDAPDAHYFVPQIRPGV